MNTKRKTGTEEIEQKAAKGAKKERKPSPRPSPVRWAREKIAQCRSLCRSFISNQAFGWFIGALFAFVGLVMPAKSAEPALIIITPHVDAIRNEFARGF